MDAAIPRQLETAHLPYEINPAYEPLTSRMYQVLASMVGYAASLDGKSPREFRVLDVGPGRGELMNLLAGSGYPVEGLDLDPVCVSMSSQYGPCRFGSTDDIIETYNQNEFDLVVASHVIEHVRDPLGALEAFRYAASRWILLAVPNPIRPLAIYKNLLRKPWSNPTHIAIWDHSHFANFLQLHAKLEIVREESDYVEIVWGHLRSLLYQLGMLKPLSWMEINLLSRLFPRFSTSIIALCRIPDQAWFTPPAQAIGSSAEHVT